MEQEVSSFHRVRPVGKDSKYLDKEYNLPQPPRVGEAWDDCKCEFELGPVGQTRQAGYSCSLKGHSHGGIKLVGGFRQAGHLPFKTLSSVSAQCRAGSILCPPCPPGVNLFFVSRIVSGGRTLIYCYTSSQRKWIQVT